MIECWQDFSSYGVCCYGTCNILFLRVLVVVTYLKGLSHSMYVKVYMYLVDFAKSSSFLSTYCSYTTGIMVFRDNMWCLLIGYVSQFYEVIVRYEKFFSVETSFIAPVVVSISLWLELLISQFIDVVSFDFFIGNFPWCEWIKTFKYVFKKSPLISTPALHQIYEVSHYYLGVHVHF